jgi:tetratricopeptide (TPR) repeat protein
MAAIIPPNLPVSEVMGILKGKTATAVFQQAKRLRTKPYRGNHFWSRGYCVTTAGIDGEKMRRHVKYQEDAERLDEDHELQEGPIVEAKHSSRRLWRRLLTLLRLPVFYAILAGMENAASLNSSGIALTEADRPHEAIPLFRRALDMEPGNPLLWLNLGIAQQRTGEYDAALDSFRRAAGIDDSLADAWGSMGLILFERKDFGAAEECYRASIARDGGSAKVWNNLGALFFNQSRFEDARRCFEEALSRSPLLYDALFNMRDVCRELRDYRAASEFGRVLSGLKPGGY